MTTAKKAPAKKAAVKKTSGSKYGPAASKNVEREMKAMKSGTLKSGNSDKKVTNPKQAIAIALSESRRAGNKVPPPPGKSAAKKTTAKTTSAKNSPARKASAS